MEGPGFQNILKDLESLFEIIHLRETEEATVHCRNISSYIF